MALWGDFNEILTLTEKKGVATIPQSQMEAFQITLEDCHMSDLRFFGPQFTWNNDHSGRDFTKERLDRGVANQEWCEIHKFLEVSVLACRSSDHNPLSYSRRSKSLRSCSNISHCIS